MILTSSPNPRGATSVFVVDYSLIDTQFREVIDSAFQNHPLNKGCIDFIKDCFWTFKIVISIQWQAQWWVGPEQGWPSESQASSASIPGSFPRVHATGRGDDARPFPSSQEPDLFDRVAGVICAQFPKVFQTVRLHLFD
jgi:hypothetical protein